MLDEIVVTNVLIFLLIVARASSDKIVYIRVGVIAWVVLNTILFYALVVQVGASNPFFGFYGVKVPWYGVIVLSLALVLLPIGSKGGNSLRFVTMLVAAMGMAYVHNVAAINPLLNRSASEMEHVLYAFTLVIPFAVCVLCSLPWFAEDGASALRKVFLPTRTDMSTHRRPVLRGLAAFAIVFLVSNLVNFGQLAEFHIITSPRLFSLYAIVACFYWALFEHFVAIGLCRRVMEKLFPDQKPSGYEVVFFAVLLASLYYNTEIQFMIREFFYGLIFGYLYLRTGTLFYGIGMRFLAAFFVA